MGTKETVVLNFDLPADLHAELKSQAALRRLTIKAAVIQAIHQWITRPGLD